MGTWEEHNGSRGRHRSRPLAVRLGIYRRQARGVEEGVQRGRTQSQTLLEEMVPKGLKTQEVPA